MTATGTRHRSGMYTVFGAAALALVLAGTGSACGSGSGSSPTGVGFKEPSHQALQSALLTAGEVGSPYTADNSGGGNDKTVPGGCPDFDNSLADMSPGQTLAEADFSAGDNGPFVSEQIATEAQAQFTGDLNRSIHALESCRAVTLNDSGTQLTLTLTPATGFPSGCTADELAGSLQGVQISGDLAIQRVGSAAILYTFVQLGRGSSPAAASIFAKALNKARSQLG